MVKGGGTFSKKCFLYGTNFVWKIYEGVVLQGLMIRLRGKEFHKTYFAVI